MGDWFTEWRVQQYVNETEMLVQDRGGRLRPGMKIKTGLSGKGARPIKQYGEAVSVDYDYTTDRKSDTPDATTPADARWYYPLPIEWGEHISDFDQDNLDDNPLPDLMNAGRMAIARGEDDKILQAFFATAKTGETGSTDTTFPAGNTVAAAAMSHTHLRDGLKILMGNEVEIFENGPDMGIYCVISEVEWYNLFGEDMTTSTDWVDGKPVQTARLPRLYGLTFIPISSARLNANGLVTTGTASLPMWQKGGMGLGLWRNVQVSVLPRNDRRGDPHAYIRETIGVTRLQEKKVVNLQCTGH